MKKIIAIGVTVLMTLGLTACSNKSDKNINSDTASAIVVGATAVPHAEMLNEIVDDLQAEGITLVVKEFSDYTILNKSLEEGQIDANFFQHTEYLEDDIKNSGAKLTSVGAIHIEPMGIYTKKGITSLDNIEDGAKISIPNDKTNGSRALKLLEKSGIIKLKDGVTEATIFDIEENPKNLEIKELDAATLPRTLDEVAISVINTNYALVAGFNPMEDAILMEGSDSPYANILVVREGDENKEAIKKLYNALTSEEMRTFIQEKYNGAVIPAF